MKKRELEEDYELIEQQNWWRHQDDEMVAQEKEDGHESVRGE